MPRRLTKKLEIYGINDIHQYRDAQQWNKVDEFHMLNFFDGGVGSLDLQLNFKDYKRSNYMIILYTDDFYKYWNITILFTICTLFLFLPIELAEPSFKDNEGVQYFNNLITSIFIFDIFINFFTVYEDVKGQFKYDYGSIACYYLQTWFFIDIISTVEINWFIGDQTTDGTSSSSAKVGTFSKYQKYYKFLKITRTLKLLRILKFKKQLGGFLKFYLDKSSTKIIFQTFLLVVFCHIFACIYISSAKNGADQCKTVEDLECPQTWYTTIKGYYGEEMLSYEFDNVEIYSIAWYMAIQTVTTVGYGDVPTINFYERLVKMLGMFLGAYLFSFVSASIISYAVDQSMHNNVDKKLQLLFDDIIDRYGINSEGINKMSKALVQNNIKMLNDEFNFLTYRLEENDRDKIFEQIFNYYLNYINVLQSHSLVFFKLVYPNLILKKFDKDTFLNYFTPMQDDFFLIDDFNDADKIVDIKQAKGDYVKASLSYDNKIMILITGQVAYYDKYLLKYNLEQNGIYSLVQYGDMFNLDKIVFHSNLVWDDDYMVFDQSEVMEIDLDGYYSAIKTAYHQDIDTIKQYYRMLFEDSKRQIYAYILTKLAIYYILFKRKSLKFYICTMDLYNIECSLNIDAGFQTQMIRVLNANIYAPKLGNSPIWFHKFLTSEELDFIKSYASELTKTIVKKRSTELPSVVFEDKRSQNDRRMSTTKDFNQSNYKRFDNTRTFDNFEQENYQVMIERNDTEANVISVSKDSDSTPLNHYVSGDHVPNLGDPNNEDYSTHMSLDSHKKPKLTRFNQTVDDKDKDKLLPLDELTGLSPNLKLIQKNLNGPMTTKLNNFELDKINSYSDLDSINRDREDILEVHDYDVIRSIKDDTVQYSVKSLLKTYKTQNADMKDQVQQILNSNKLILNKIDQLEKMIIKDNKHN